MCSVICPLSVVCVVLSVLCDKQCKAASGERFNPQMSVWLFGLVGLSYKGQRQEDKD